MQPMTAHFATADGLAANGLPVRRPAAGQVPSSRSSIERQERGMLFAPRVSSPMAPAFLARVRRIEDAQRQWAKWRSLPLQAKRNWLTTKFYLARCEALRRRIQTRDVVRSWAASCPTPDERHPVAVRRGAAAREDAGTAPGKPICGQCNGKRRVRYSANAPSWLTRTCPSCVVEMSPGPNGLPRDV